MPIIPKIETRRLSQDEFGEVAYDLMNHVFAIHNEMGRFFDEGIYKNALALQLGDATFEARVDVTFESFQKSYFADLIVEEGALFEFITTDQIHPQHVGQTVNYLLLFNLAHGKIINLRPEKVESRFVNFPKQLTNLRNPNIFTDRYKDTHVKSKAFRDVLVSLVRDWGTGLEIKLYEKALIHFLGGEDKICRKTEVNRSRSSIGTHEMNHLSEDEVFWLTGFPEPDPRFEAHAQKLLQHTNLKAIQWANLSQKTVSFTTIN